MSDLISRSALMEKVNKIETNFYFDQFGKYNPVLKTVKIINCIEDAPTVDAVPKSYANQIRWERDIAIEQLKEIGCSFGQKMDDVKKKLDAVPVVRGEWLRQDETFTRFMCSQCGSKNHAGHENFCPNCGADMRKKVE